ncbi:hypothetical protein ASC82_07925 [Streptomyces sp. Root431]|uniref:hypothetical protein n=1 Tax=Streptomyces sp. Root431 TaxID=1736535 RepID=UPI0006FE162F|nr:hypothetical protein [Streptomyces sp. Root431]KQX13851.1 hypothetical protein ASC82_07925 [Streptomyces sp. Root431]
MASHRKLRAAAVVCAVIAVAGPAPAAAWAAAPTAAQAPASAPAAVPAWPAAAPAPAPSPDPFANLTPDEIAERAVTATQSATSLRMTGRVVADGEPLDIDFAVNDRDECTGVMKIGGGTAELRRVDDLTYMKGDEAFWRVSMASQGMPEAQIDATIELIKGRWLKIAPGQAGSSDLSGVCDLKGLLADLDEDKEERTGLVRGPDGEVDDTPVATLVKKKTGGETTTVSVSEEGKPYILKMVKAGGDEPGSMLLSDYDKPVDVTVPPADETVDLSKLDPGSTAA